MSLKHVVTKNAPASPVPGLFAQAVRAGPFLYTQGTPGARPDGTMVEGTIADRTRQAIKNLEKILAAEGMTLNDVVKATIFIKNFDENFPLVNQVWEEMMPEPRPTRTTVGVAQLPAGGTDIEIEFVGYKA
ncbi:endoribonuclease L-PSP [Trichoderma gamsii]|uniref:Endoribonuclease L-PSP n=1 Tax=Trichoderma gamsii TaxID=398673 RepID=A0A2P5A0H7_9HYPO|nr:endoribonuclease L-PSP [Trichoderma gamsii]PON30049.1 endoribonuclease L-PSP [Trichoderma gamsii]